MVMWSSSRMALMVQVHAWIDCMHLALRVDRKFTTPPSLPTHSDSGYYLLNRTKEGVSVCLNATVCSNSGLKTLMVLSSEHETMSGFLPTSLIMSMSLICLKCGESTRIQALSSKLTYHIVLSVVEMMPSNPRVLNCPYATFPSIIKVLGVSANMECMKSSLWSLSTQF